MYSSNHTSVALRDRLVYGVSCFGKDLVYGLISCIIFLYCIKVLNISITFLGVLYLSHQIIGALLCPFLGTIIDHTKSCIGKYKPYIIIGTVINLIAIGGFCFIDQFPYEFRYLYLSVIYFVWSCSYFMLDVPSWATLSIFNANVHTRDSMAAIPSISNFVGSQLLFIGVLPVLAGFTGLFNLHNIEYSLICLICGLILLCSQGAFVLFLKTSPLDFNQAPSHFIPPSFVNNQEPINTNKTAQGSSYSKGSSDSKSQSEAVSYGQSQIKTYGQSQSNGYKSKVEAYGQGLSKSDTYGKAQSKGEAYALNQSKGEAYDLDSSDGLYNSYMLEHTNYNPTRHARDFYDQISNNPNGSEGTIAFNNNQSSLVKFLNLNVFKANPLKQMKRMSRIIFNNDQLLVLFSCSILLNTMNGVIFGALTSSFLDTQLLEHSNLYFILFFACLIQCASMAIFERLARHTPRSWIFNGAVVIAMMAFALTTLISSNNAFFYALLSACIFIGSCCIGLCQVAVSSMTIDTVDYGEFKLNLRTDGLIFAVRSMAKHFGVLISFFFYGGAVSLGYHFDVAEIIVPNISMDWAITIVTLLGICAIVIFTIYYKLNGAFYRNILNNLQYLRQNQRAGSSQDPAVDKHHFMLRYCLDESTMIIKLQARNLDDLIEALVQKLSKVNAITSELDYMHDLKARLALGPCGIAEGIALPHAKSSSVRRATVVVATLDEPLDLGALDDRKCDLVFLLASPDDGETHLNLLGRLSLLLNEPGFADKLRSSGSPTELFERLIQCEKHIVN